MRQIKIAIEKQNIKVQDNDIAIVWVTTWCDFVKEIQATCCVQDIKKLFGEILTTETIIKSLQIQVDGKLQKLVLPAPKASPSCKPEELNFDQIREGLKNNQNALKKLKSDVVAIQLSYFQKYVIEVLCAINISIGISYLHPAAPPAVPIRPPAAMPAHFNSPVEPTALPIHLPQAAAEQRPAKIKRTSEELVEVQRQTEVQSFENLLKDLNTFKPWMYDLNADSTQAPARHIPAAMPVHFNPPIEPIAPPIHLPQAAAEQRPAKIKRTSEELAQGMNVLKNDYKYDKTTGLYRLRRDGNPICPEANYIIADDLYKTIEAFKTLEEHIGSIDPVTFEGLNDQNATRIAADRLAAKSSAAHPEIANLNTETT